MNFSQLHERLRVELLRRIERDVLTATLLAQRTGLQQPHISNFLRGKRRLSMDTLDRVLAALGLTTADLMDLPARRSTKGVRTIPVISSEQAVFDDAVRFDTAVEHIMLLPDTLRTERLARGAGRPKRERFVAVRINAAQAQPMEPLLQPNSIVVIDRHSTLPTYKASLTRSIFALLFEGSLQFFYLSLEADFLILRPHSSLYQARLLAVPFNVAPSDLVTGRVCHVQFPL